MNETSQRVTVGRSIRFLDDPQFFWNDAEYGDLRVRFGPANWGAYWDVIGAIGTAPPTLSMMAMLALSGEAAEYFLTADTSLPNAHKFYWASIKSLRDYVLADARSYTADEWREGFTYVMRWGLRPGKVYVMSLMPGIIRTTQAHL